MLQSQKDDAFSAFSKICLEKRLLEASPIFSGKHWIVLEPLVYVMPKADPKQTAKETRGWS